MTQNLCELSTIDYSEKDGVAWIRLNRPEKHNALNIQLRQELQLVWRAVRDRPEVRCVVLTGSGDKAFCSGIDRNDIIDEGQEFDPFSYDDLAAEIGPKTNGLWKPVIAAVNGIACGGAFYLLGESEFIIAAEHASFFDPHVTYGMPAVYEPILLHGRMAFGDLMRMSLMGLSERMSAHTAQQKGLVSQVVPGKELESVVRDVAESIAIHPPAPVQTTVRSLWAARRLGVSGAVDMGNMLLGVGTHNHLLQDGQHRFRSEIRNQPADR
ncbi:enoyl-CoA hydratase/carnithine racemase [Mycobacteroides chelonae]|nr:enoyl-CoA hydratase/carnithine racemase [Mycobacteroides chelonae]